jgi:hypothetical protein
VESGLKVGSNQRIRKQSGKNGRRVWQSVMGADGKQTAQKKASGTLPDAFLEHTINPSVN